MTILIDIDNVCCNTTESVLNFYNKKFNDNLKVSDIKTYYIEEYVKPEARNSISEIFEDKDMWKTVKAINVDAIQWLIDHFDVYFCTATTCSNIKKKENFLRRTFRNIDISKRLIRATNKQMIIADYLIDDCADNFGGSVYNAVCIAYPWNESFLYVKYNTGRYNNVAEWIESKFGVTL